MRSKMLTTRRKMQRNKKQLALTVKRAKKLKKHAAKTAAANAPGE